MDDPIEFLNARLDEDEAAAKWASEGPWTLRGGGYVVGGPDDRDGLRAVTVAAQAQQWNGEHIVRHDPARALREVAAKRAIVAEHEFACCVKEVCCGEIAGEYDSSQGDPCPTVRHLAAVWEAHPDYRPEWKPLSEAVNPA